MAKKDTAAFFRFINEMNASITEDKVESTAGLDQIRLERDAERRERLGTLRAREHIGSRPVQVRNIYGYIDPS